MIRWWLALLVVLALLASCTQQAAPPAAPAPTIGTTDVPAADLGLCGDPATLIHDVQGADLATPLAGVSVVIEGVVVGDFQADNQLRGFFVQEEDADADADAATSEGIFVFARGATDVQVGDAVRVLGTVSEYFSLTQVTLRAMLACGSAPVPAAAAIEFPLTSRDALEAFEGMLVTFPQELLISEYFNFGRYGEIVLAHPIEPFGRHYQPTSHLEPSVAAARFETIALNRITLDDGRPGQNPDPALHPNGDVFDLDNRFRGGDTLTNVTGVMDYGFGRYRIQPTAGADHSPTNPRPVAPEPVGGNVTVAAFNVLNYFSTIGGSCGPLANQDCRGADDAEEFTRQRNKIFAALAGLDADIVGLIELENDAGDVALLDLVAGLNDVVGSGTYAAVETGPIGPDAIRVALIYKPATVALVGGFAVLDTPDFLDPNGLGGAQNRPALAQTFAPVAGGHGVTVVVNHFKSKGSGCGAGDDDPVQGNCNLTRTLAATALLGWLATDPTNTGETDVLLIGDYNAYDEEAPVDVLLAGGFDDLLERFSGEDAYTYVFDGLLGHLDYALATTSLAESRRVTGATAWAINADEPSLLDYDTTFKLPAQDALYEPNAFRSSDHDPVLVGLDLSNRAPDCSSAAAAVGRLWPANHKLVGGSVTGVTDPDADPITITIDAIFQDEPVQVPGSGSTKPDATIGHGNAFEVRAERDARGDGRVYHVAFTADDGAVSCTGVVHAAVALRQGRNGGAVDGGPLYDSTVD